MLMRDSPGLCVYFGLFEAFKKQFGVSETDRQKHKYHGLSEAQVNFRKFFAGGFAATISWSLLFPVDSIKTKIQTTNIANQSASAFTRELIHREGIGSLYKGLSVTVMRAFPTGACSLLVNDSV
jgi:solute carrier family 25 (mitochondrial carnitine/acylcarnitine transporter), member 20/29